jgi:hypothetical protein
MPVVDTSLGVGYQKGINLAGIEYMYGPGGFNSSISTMRQLIQSLGVNSFLVCVLFSFFLSPLFFWGFASHPLYFFILYHLSFLFFFLSLPKT